MKTKYFIKEAGKELFNQLDIPVILTPHSGSCCPPSEVLIVMGKCDNITVFFLDFRL